MQFRIGELAEKCGVNKETIRYYERLGLIPEPNRTEKRYRMYSQQTIDRLNFIKQMQELGFTLNEIDKLLGVVNHNEANFCSLREECMYKTGGYPKRKNIYESIP